MQACGTFEEHLTDLTLVRVHAISPLRSPTYDFDFDLPEPMLSEESSSSSSESNDESNVNCQMAPNSQNVSMHFLKVMVFYNCYVLFQQLEKKHQSLFEESSSSSSSESNDETNVNCQMTPNSQNVCIHFLNSYGFLQLQCFISAEKTSKCSH